MKKLLFVLTIATVLTACGPKNYSDSAPFPNRLTQNALEESLTLGTDFLIAQQTEAGNFNYQYDFITKTFNQDDNQVRQAGALWALTLLYANDPENQALKEAAEKGIAYFETHSGENDAGRFVAYPGETQGKTGTQALFVLSLLTYGAENKLEPYLDFLLSLRQNDGRFYSKYSLDTGTATGDPSSYYDGETLLALAKLHKIKEDRDFTKLVQESAESMYEDHVLNALDEDPDSDETKGFYQWSSMAFYELYTGPGKKTRYADWAIELAYWMVDDHELLSARNNTAYAYEGIIHAWELARLSGDQKAEEKLASVIDEGLFKLTTWQVTPERIEDPLAIGGIPNEKNGATLRIDVTQHQMHAVLLALKFLFAESE